VTTATVIVSYDDPQATARAVASAHAQTIAPDEVVVVDNHPAHPTLALDLPATVLTPGDNLGFAGGAALGARATSAEWILFLNPDAVAAPDCVEHLLAAAADGTGLIGAQVLLGDGRVNAGDNPVHLAGIAWSGGFEQPREDGPPRGVASVSGAAMLARRAALDAVGGISERFFLYYEDVDLGWRMRLAGWDVVFQPAALATHDYDFDKGTRKWFFLERNRAWTLLTCYSATSLILLAPLLLATELAVAARARREGWWPEKREAWGALWRERRAIRARRREIQASRVAGDGEIVGRMTATFDTTLVDAPLVRRASPLLEAYRRLVIACG
jgi:GT2 family glycosyltransferase